MFLIIFVSFFTFNFVFSCCYLFFSPRQECVEWRKEDCSLRATWTSKKPISSSSSERITSSSVQFDLSPHCDVCLTEFDLPRREEDLDYPSTPRYLIDPHGHRWCKGCTQKFQTKEAQGPTAPTRVQCPLAKTTDDLDLSG